MRRFIYLLLFWLLVDPTFADIVQPQPQAKLSATLQRVDSQPISPRSVLLRLTVENLGEAPLTLIRLRSRNLERHAAWYGWNIQIDGSNRNWGFVAIPKIVGPLSDGDFIDLSPGESFSLLIDIGQAATRKQPFTNTDPNAWLFETKGEYKVTVSYTPDKRFWSQLKREDVSIQSVRSNTLKVAIKSDELPPKGIPVRAWYFSVADGIFASKHQAACSRGWNVAFGYCS